MKSPFYLAVYAVEAKSNPKYAPLTKGTVAMVTDEYKIIHYLSSKESGVDFETYDLKNDPEERKDLSMTNNSMAEDLKGILLNKIEEVNQAQ